MDHTEMPHLRDSVNLTGEESTRLGHSDVLQQGSRPSTQNINKKTNKLPCNPASTSATSSQKQGGTEEHVKRHHVLKTQNMGKSTEK